MIIQVPHKGIILPPQDVIVDDDWLDNPLSHHEWVIPRGITRYVCFLIYPAGKTIPIFLHRQIMRKVPHLDKRNTVDHINRNIYDNSRANLRWVTKEENRRNTVAWDKRMERYGS